MRAFASTILLLFVSVAFSKRLKLSDVRSRDRMGTLLGVVGIGADAGLGVSAMEDSRRNGGIEGIREHYVDSAGSMR